MLTIELNHDEIEALNKALTMLSEHTYENHLDQLDNVLASYEIDSDYHNHASKRAHDIYDNEKNIIDNLFKKITLVEKEIT